MRFLALSAAALSLASSSIAQSTSSWSTATSTRTVYMIKTETRTGTPPAETQNSTSSSTVYTRPSYGAPVPTSAMGNGTVSTPTTAGVKPTFTGAAVQNAVGSIVVLIGGAVVALAL